jgi:hypothetical protein
VATAKTDGCRLLPTHPLLPHFTAQRKRFIAETVPVKDFDLTISRRTAPQPETSHFHKKWRE